MFRVISDYAADYPNLIKHADGYPTPAYLRDDYPYKAVGEAITDLDTLETGVVYEIRCDKCQMSIRSQGQNIRSQFERLKSSGCIGCGNKELVIRKVDMSAAK